MSVEAEVGTVGGNEDGVVGGIKYADLNECVRLVQEANVDALAPALGSVHGPYQGEPVLGFTEMEAIGKATNMPLVLHGGTGIPDEKIKKAIACGTCKINVNTECQLAFNKLLREFLNDEKNELIILALNSLSPREGQIIKYRYGYDDGVFHSFSEVANKFSISRQRAQILSLIHISEPTRPY